MLPPYAHPGWFLYPERRLWSNFRCDLSSTAPWSSAHPKSGKNAPCRRYFPRHGAVLLRCSTVESRTKCNSVPKEPAVLHPITPGPLLYKLKNAEGSSHMGRDSSAFFISCFLIARSTVSRALLQCTDHSHCFSTSFSLFKSSGLAICSFMPVFFASCTSSAKAFAVMAMMGTLPRLPARARIAAVAS